MEYQQQIRDAIFTRESQGLPIYEIADAIEKIVREKIAQEIESYIDADHEARAFTFAADLARGINANL